MTLPQYVWSQQDLHKCALSVLDQMWPLEPSRMIRLCLQNLKKRTPEDKANIASLETFFTTNSSSNSAGSTMGDQLLNEREVGGLDDLLPAQVKEGVVCPSKV